MLLHAALRYKYDAHSHPLTLPATLQGPSKEELLEPYPKLRAWLDRVRERCSPVYEEVSETLHQGTAMMTKALQKIEASKM